MNGDYIENYTGRVLLGGMVCFGLLFAGAAWGGGWRDLFLISVGVMLKPLALWYLCLFTSD